MISRIRVTRNGLLNSSYKPELSQFALRFGVIVPVGIVYKAIWHCRMDHDSCFPFLLQWLQSRC